MTSKEEGITSAEGTSLHGWVIFELSYRVRVGVETGYRVGASLVAQRAKCLPAMWETWVRSLGWEDLLEKKMATHSSTLAWKIPRTEEPGRLQSMALQRVEHD